MNPRWRMLLWEQWRIVRHSYAIIFSAFLFGILCLRFLVYVEAFEFRHTEEFSVIFLLISYLWGVGAILLRRNTKGFLTYDFDSRCFLLPISTPLLVAVMLIIRLLGLVILYTILLAANQLLLGNIDFRYPDVTPIDLYLTFLYLYLCLQAFAWGWKPLKGVMYLILLGMIAFAFACIIRPEYMIDTLFASLLIEDSALHIPTTISICAVALCFIAVHFQRQERNSRIPTYHDVMTWLNSLGATRADRFSSPFEAQLWYERRRVGRLLPWAIVIGSIIGVPLLLMFEVDFSRDTFVLFYSPLFFLLIAVFYTANIILRKSHSTYSFKHPIPDIEIAFARLLAVARSFFVVLCALTIPMFFVLYRSPFEHYMLSEALANESIDIAYIATMILRPLLFFGALSWLLIWILAPYVLRTAIVIFLYAIATGLEWDYFGLPSYLPYMVFCIYIAAIACSCINALVYKKIYSLKQLLPALYFWFSVIVLAVGVSLFSSWSDAIILNTAILANITLLPFLAVPLYLAKQRVG